MNKNRYAVINDVSGDTPARGVSRTQAVRTAIEHGIGCYDVVEGPPGVWMLHVGLGSSARPTGFGVTASSREEAERGCLAIASLRSIWGRCAVVQDDDVDALLSCIIA